MRHRSLFFAAAVAILLGSASWDNYPQRVDNPNTNVQLSITAAKESYVLGEIVTLNLRVQNDRSERITIDRPDQENGHILFYISRDGVNFLRYLNPTWHRPSGYIWLQPNDGVDGAAALIWNKKPVVHHLNPDAARRVQKGKILTDYAFPEPGTYYVKAIVWGAAVSRRALPKIESEPIEITIEEPEGQDLEAWNAIKDREDIAYFMQECHIKGINRQERERLAREYEEMAARYPTSIIAAQLRQKLREYRTWLGIVSNQEKNR